MLQASLSFTVSQSLLRFMSTESVMLSQPSHPPLPSSPFAFNLSQHQGLSQRVLFCLVSCSVQFSSVTQSCPTLRDPMNGSTPGLPVHHQLSEFTHTHVHRVSDAIQPSHPLSSPSRPAPHSLPASESFPMSQLFARGGQSTGVSALASFLPKKSQG